MVLRLIGLHEETNYAQEIANTDEPDFHKRVSKSSAKLNDDPITFKSGSRMNHLVRSGVIKPTLEIEASTDLKTLTYVLAAFLDQYTFTAGTSNGPNTHEFYGGECANLRSFSGWATFDDFQKLLKGLIMDNFKLDVSNESMTCTESWVYSDEKHVPINAEEYDVIEMENIIPIMFYDVSVFITGAPVPGVATSLSIEGNNNLNVDNTIGLGGRRPQKAASAQERAIKLSVGTTMTPATADIIRKAEYGDDIYVPSDCKIFKTDFKIEIEYCEDSNQKLVMIFPQCFVRAEYEGQNAEEITATLTLESLGSGEVELLDGTTVQTDMYAKLINDVDEVSPS